MRERERERDRERKRKGEREREREREDLNKFPLKILVIPPTKEAECYQALSYLDKLIY